MKVDYGDHQHLKMDDHDAAMQAFEDPNTKENA